MEMQPISETMRALLVRRGWSKAAVGAVAVLNKGPGAATMGTHRQLRTAGGENRPGIRLVWTHPSMTRTTKRKSRAVLVMIEQ